MSAGNAYFVTELLATGGSRPASVRDAVLGRVAASSPRAGRWVLEVASQLGLRCDAGVLAAASGADAAGIDDCVERGLLVRFGDELGFAHELSRATIADEIPPVRRAAVHRALLRVLEQQSGRTDVARLADHAADANEADAAFRYGLRRRSARGRAGLAPAGRPPLPDRVAVRVGRRTARERAALLDALAQECMVTDQLDDALVAAEESLTLWTEIGDADPGRRVAQRSLDRVAWYLGYGERARAAHATWPSKSSNRSARPASSPARSRPPGRAARSSSATARTGSRSASARSRSPGRPATPTPSRMRSTRSAAAFAWGDRFDDGVDHPADVRSTSRWPPATATWPGGLTRTWPSVLADTHRYDRSDAVLAEGLRYTDDHDLTLRFVCLTGVLAGSEMERGRWDDALADATGMLERTGTMTVGRIPALTVIGTIGMRRGDETAHTMLLEEARSLRRGRLRDPRLRARSRPRWPRKRWLAGDARPRPVASSTRCSTPEREASSNSASAAR